MRTESRVEHKQKGCVVRNASSAFKSVLLQQVESRSPPASASSSPPLSPPSEQTGWGNRTCTPCSACFRHTLEPLCCRSTSSRPPGGVGDRGSSQPRARLKARAWPRLPTHAAAGSAVVPPPGEGVERLRARHAHAHLVVSDPAGGAAAQLLCLEHTCAAVYPNVCAFNAKKKSSFENQRLTCAYLSGSQPEALVLLLKHINCILNVLQMKGKRENKSGLTLNASMKPLKKPRYLNPLISVQLGAG